MNVTLRLWDGYPHTSEHLQPDVRSLQEALNKAGASLVCDGYFGRGTEVAVINFQHEHNLSADGIVGPRTWAVLNGEKARDVLDRETAYSLADPSMIAQKKEAHRYSSAIHSAATIAQVHVSIICGIGSRESHWGLALTPKGPGGTGDFIKRNGRLPSGGGGWGKGLMQIDYAAHEFARTGPWYDAVQNIRYGGQVLADNIRYYTRREDCRNYTHEERLRMAIAAYNCGPGNVNKAIKNNRDIDYYTHGRDYSRDVLSRAGWFEMVGWR